MTAYNLYVDTAPEKYAALAVIRAAGVIVSGVSGCGPGYYIQMDATPEQADAINAALDAARG